MLKASIGCVKLRRWLPGFLRLQLFVKDVLPVAENERQEPAAGSLGSGLVLPVVAFASERPAIVAVMHYEIDASAQIEREVILDHEFRRVRSIQVMFAVLEPQWSFVFCRIVGNDE